MSDPILLVVRRGALKRFDALQRQTSNMQVEVIWDRRARPRRATNAAKPPATPERRSTDRRQRNAYTWQAADFVVAVPSDSENKK